MEEIKNKLEPILEKHVALNEKCEKNYGYDMDNFEREKIWTKEVEAISGVDFHEILTYLDTIKSAKKLEALSENFYDEIAHNLFGNKSREVLNCFRKNNKRLNAGLDDFLREVARRQS